MRILLLHDYGSATGGAELQILALRRDLLALGHDVRLLSSTVTHVPAAVLSDYQCAGAMGKLQAVTQTINLSAVTCLRRAIREFRPDVIHVRMFLWQLSPMILPLLRNTPSLYQPATYKSICPRGTKLLPDGTDCEHKPGFACLQEKCLTPQSWALLMLQRRLWLRWRSVFRRIVALGDNMRVQLEKEGLGPVDVIHNGVPMRPMRAALRSPPTIGYAGRLSAEKGVDVLIHAFARLREKQPETRLLIAGQGSEEGSLRQLAQRLHISDSIDWAGHLSREEMEKVFDHVWVQAAPSLWHEPFGNVATEASMRGTPAVVSSSGGLAEIIRHGETGFHTKPGDVDALAMALATLTSDQALVEKMGQAGHARAVAEFSEQRCTQQFEALYRELTAQAS